MQKYYNPRLHNAVVAGTGMEHPRRPHVVLGSELNGYVQGDLVDANGICDLIHEKNVDTFAKLEALEASLKNESKARAEDMDNLSEQIDRTIAEKLSSTETVYGESVQRAAEDERLQSQINDLNAAIQEHQDISGKADKTAVYAALATKADKSTTYTKEEVDNLIDGVDVSEQLENYYTEDETDAALAGKQDTIDDLSTIRSGAAAGATAVQPAALTPIENDIDAIEGKIPSAASTSNQLADKAFVNSALADKADAADIPTALSQLSQDSTHRTVTDSEKSTWDGKQDTLTFDNTPTANSNNPVTSGGVMAALDLKADQSTTYTKTEVDNELADGVYIGNTVGTDIKQLKDKNNVVFYPQTHTKAVVDDNGYTVESRMQAVQDVVNQAQMAIGAVPSDLAPTEDSTNWVTSGGIFNATVFPQDIFGVYVNYGYFMSASNTYISHSTYKGFFMPVAAGEVYSVTGVNGNAATFAIVKNKNISNGMTIPFATGYEQRIVTDAGGSIQVTIPSDGKYMFVQTVMGAGDVRPIIKRLYGVASIADSLTYDYVVSSDDGIKLPRYITANSAWDSTIAGRGSTVYPVDGIEGIDITANENYGTYYVFLTSYADDAVHWCDCMAIRPTLTAGSSISLSVPSDAKYFYIYTGDYGACFPSRLVFKKTLRSYEGQISEIGTKVDGVYASIGDETFGDWTSFNLATNGTSYSNLFIGGVSGDGKWTSINGKTVKVAAIPTGSKFVKVVCGSNSAPIFLLQSTKAPVSQQNAETSVGYPDRIIINANTTTVIPLLPDCKAIAWSSTAVNAPQSIAFATTPTSLADIDKEWQTECIVANSCDTVEFNDTPIQCISTDDANATQYDNKVIGNVCVIRISDTMYYMYYVCCGQNEQSGDQYLHLAMAYSTDGFTWTRGIPNGIEPPIAGTNLLINTGCIGECVVKVQDAEYPFRMIGGNWHQSTSLYKSADGVHWEVIRTWPYYFDNQASIIVRGNMMKIYMRMRNGTNREDRYLGVAYMDIWGNLLAPPTIYFGKYLYLAGASAIDDHREILFPTYFNASDSKAWLTCYIVDGLKVYPKEVDFTTILPNDGNWREVCPNMVNIGSEWYVYFGYCNSLHDSFSSSTVRTYKCAKVTWNRVGYWWYPQS